MSENIVTWKHCDHGSYFSIPEEKFDRYHGCGHGWVELTPAAEFVDMRYADSAYDHGSSEQNVDCIAPEDFRIGDRWDLKNGNYRLFGNFGSHCFYRF